jgi:hypothetical protein
VVGCWVACSRSTTGKAIGDAHRGHEQAAAAAPSASGQATERPPPRRRPDGQQKGFSAGGLALGLAGGGAKIGLATLAVWLLGKASRRRKPTPGASAAPRKPARPGAS